MSNAAGYLIEVLSQAHDKKGFSCGNQALDHYLQHQAGQDLRRHVAATFVLREKNSLIVAGYHALAATSIELGRLPLEISKKLPRYPLLPATLLGRLAVDEKYQGKGLGRLLLINALKRSLKLSKEIAAMAVVVDAIDQKAIQFYQYYGFIPFLNKGNQLFLPMRTVEQMLEVPVPA